MAAKTNYNWSKTLLIVGFICWFIPLSAQIPGLSWEKQLPLNRSHYFADVIELSGGNFLLVGAVDMPGERKFDLWLVELDQKGDTVKTRIVENPGDDVPFRILQHGGEGFLIAYMTTGSGAEFQAGLMSLDAAYLPRWQCLTEKPAALMRTDVAVDESGDAWWLNTFAGEGGQPVAALWKMDDRGTKTAEFTLDERQSLTGYSLKYLQDGSLGLACLVQPSAGKTAVQVIKMNREGKALWKTQIDQTGKMLTPQCICCSPDNSLLVGGWAGLCYNPDAPADQQIWDYDYLLTRLDAGGKILWTQNYNREGSEKGTAIAALPDGNIMAAGKCETSFTGTVGPWLLFVDKNGKLVKDQVYKFRFVKDQVARIICTSDNGLLMVGPGYIGTEYQLSGWVKKLNPIL